jgi:hypothetical protein
MGLTSHAELLREYLERLSETGSDSAPLLRWPEWLRMRMGGVVALGTALTLTGCYEAITPLYGAPMGGSPAANQGGSAGSSSTPRTDGSSGTVQGGSAGTTATNAAGMPIYAAPMTGGSAGAIQGGSAGTSSTNVAGMPIYAAPMAGSTS